ncbi:MAG: class I SAM-dependent methyltransferase [Candidatus Omnitrophota bacterium]|nr:class I SAM-dependent methyltransferase [Candidatus Omnitrophota bacterium]
MNCYICDFVTENHKVVNGFNVHTCEKCGLEWVTGVTEDDLDAFYTKKYFDSDTELGYRDYLAAEKIHRKNAKRILGIVDRIKCLSGARVLDVGCAFGFLLDEAGKFKKCHPYGVELSRYAYEYAKNTLKLDVFNNDFQSLNFESEFFDVIFLIGTIEHLMRPKDILNAVSRILKPSGLVVITTIDTSCFFPLYSYKLPEHLFYFNDTNLSLLLKEAGLKVILNKTHFGFYYYLHEVFYRLANLLSFKFLHSVSEIVRKKMPDIYVKTPTNEMILIARKGPPENRQQACKI